MALFPTGTVWFVTGSSSGFCRFFVEKALAAGHRVVATARRATDIETLGRDAEDRILRLPLDVTNSAGIAEAVVAAEARFGPKADRQPFATDC